MKFDNNFQNQNICDFLPPDWEITPLLNLLTIKHGYAFKGEFFKATGEFILMTPGHFDEQGGFRDQKEKTKYYVGEIPEGYILNKGDLLVAMTEQKSGLLGSSAFVPESGTYLHNQRLGLIEELDESRLDKQFLHHVLNTSYVRNEIAKTATGSKVKHTSPIKIRSVKIALPLSTIEQKKIAYVLSTVQRSIAQQEQLIQTTTELKKALMHKLFTEGLHGEKQKETAIGIVPESWDVVPIIKICELMSGGTPSKQRADFWDGDIPWISPKDMKVSRLCDSIDHISEAGLDAGSKLAPQNTLLIVIRGMILAKDIPVALTLRPMSFNQDMKAIVPGEDIEPDYLLYAMQFIKPYLRMHIGSSAHGTRTLLTSAIEQCLIPLPNKDVQKKLSISMKILETKISLHTKRRHALKELFQTLLHQLMTAQIRVHDIDLPGFDDLDNITPQGSTQRSD